MDLDTLKTEWAARDARLERHLKTQTLFLREMATRDDVRALQRKAGMSPAGLFFWLVFLIGFGLFTAGNFGVWEFFLPGAALFGWTLVMGVLTFRERAALARVDYSAPPVAIQAELASLRIDRLRTIQWAFLTGQLVWWVPFFIVFMRGVLGVDLYTVSDFMPGFLAVNFAVGLAIIPLWLMGAKGLRPRMAESARARGVLDSFLGRDMAEAQALARRIEAFGV